MGFPNAERGLKIKGTNFAYLSEGAYAVVFVDREQGRIRKVYRNRPDAEHDHSREVFAAETEAYAIAASNAELKQLTPAYFGPVSDQVVVDALDNDVTREFHPELAFEAEFLECQFEKAICAPENERERVFKLFRDHGIAHMSDVSVCLQNAQITKVVDFAIKEIELWWKD